MGKNGGKFGVDLGISVKNGEIWRKFGGFGLKMGKFGVNLRSVGQFGEKLGKKWGKNGGNLGDLGQKWGKIGVNLRDFGQR